MFAHRVTFPNMTITATAMILLATMIAKMVALIIASNVVFAEATTAAPTTTRNTATTTSSSLSKASFPQPLYRENISHLNITQINQTHATFTFSGNGSLTPSNRSQIINTTSNGTGLISLMTSSGHARETIRPEDGSEEITATFYEIVRFNSTTPEEGEGIVIAIFHTNSTGMLASLNGTIAAGVDNVTSGAESHITLWGWKSSIIHSNNDNSTDLVPPPSIQGELRMNTTIPKMTNATPSDTNATGGKEEQYYDLFPF